MRRITGITGLLLTAGALPALAVQRFPKPEFESGYLTPEPWLPLPRAELLVWMDVAVLLVALSLSAWLVLKRRSRTGVVWLSFFSLGYFGFYREGCICSIGAIQNVALALSGGGYAIPLTALLFFLLPLVFTLLFGRTFCAAVCPFGVVQDLVAVKPLRLGPWLNAFLGLIPFVYLGLAVLFAATATDFIICRYDPFVGLFRMNATFGMFVFAGILLLTGVIIARPYCRFLCPYGVLLNWMNRFSWKHMTITPAECISCRLCENACPYDAIEVPQTAKSPAGRRRQVNRLLLMVLLLPVLAAGGAWTGGLLAPAFSGVNPKVRLVRMLEDPRTVNGNEEVPEITAFRSSGVPQPQLVEEAAAIGRAFMTGSRLFGGFLGLVVAVTLIGLIRTPYRTGYVPHAGRCFSCARCMDYCPVEKPGKKLE